MSQAVSWSSSSSSASCRLLDRGEGGQSPLEELVAHELLVLPVSLGILVVGGGEQPPHAGLVGGDLEQLPQLVDEVARAARRSGAGSRTA